MDWPLLADLPPEDVQAAALDRPSPDVRRGEVVFHRDDPADSLHLVVRGRFGARVLTPLGDGALVDVLGPGQSFGELALLGLATRGARRPLRGPRGRRDPLRLSRRLRRLQREHPGVKDVLLRLLAEQLRRSTDRVVEAHYVDAETRVRRRVAELAAIYPSGVVPLTQEDIAAMAGTSRATVNRVLREEEKRGSVALARGRTTVLDPRPSGDAAAARLAREVVQERAEQPVEALRARDPHLLAGRVQADDLGPDRDHLDAREPLAEHGALEPAVDDRRARARVRTAAVYVDCRGAEELGVEPRLPGRIRAPHLDLRSAESRERLHRRERASSSAAAFELRAIDASVSIPSSVVAHREAAARLDDVRADRARAR